MTAVYRFDHREFPPTLQALLADLDEHFPGEISIIDYAEVKCLTPRIEMILAALTAPEVQISEAEPEPEPAQAQDAPPDAAMVPASCITAPPAMDGAKIAAMHEAVRAVARGNQPLCDECRQPFAPKQKNSRYCSQKCASRAYNREYYKKKSGKADVDTGSSGDGSGDPDPAAHLGEARLLDPDTGKIFGHQELVEAIQKGEFAEGKRFRRSHNRLYEVRMIERNGHSRLALKPVYDPLPIS